MKQPGHHGLRTGALLRLAAVASLCGLWGCGLSAPADDPRAFFAGRTLTYVVSTQPGGQYDAYGRLVATYLGRQLGVGEVVVRNMTGRGHITGANVIHASEPDGLTIGTFNPGLLYAQALDEPALVADLRRMSWIGRVAAEPRVLTVSTESEFRSIEDVRRADRALRLGTQGVGNGSYYDGLLLAHGLGLNVDFTFGLLPRDAHVSMQRGEIDGEVGSLSSHRALLESGEGVAVVRVGSGDGLDPAVPEAAELVTSEDGRALIDLVYGVSRLLWWTVGPPGIPEDRLDVLREAYMAALRDPELLAEARQLGLPVAPMDGATLDREVDRLLDAAGELSDLLAAAVRGAP